MRFAVLSKARGYMRCVPMLFGRTYGPSLGDKIKTANSAAEIDSLLTIGRTLKATSGTRRRWQKLASRRIAELTT